MIHIGMDTVQLEGKYFKYHVDKEQKVKKGDLLLEFDLQKIKEAGYETVTPVIVANTDSYQKIEKATTSSIKNGDFLLKAEV